MEVVVDAYYLPDLWYQRIKDGRRSGSGVMHAGERKLAA